MRTDDIIRNLKAVEEKYADEKPATFEVSIASMARDCRKKIEELEHEKQEGIQKMRDIYYILLSFNYSYGDNIPGDLVSDVADRLRDAIFDSWGVTLPKQK